MENIIITKKSSAKTNFLIKTLLTCVSLAVFIARPDNAGFFPGSSFVSHLTYSFCHANIFHLAANLVVLWSLRNRICLCASLFAAVLASFLPTYVSQPTVGLSGVIFAAIGIMWGKTGRFWDSCCVVMPFIVLTMLMPGVNGILHLWTYMIGFIIGRIVTKYSHIPYF